MRTFFFYLPHPLVHKWFYSLMQIIKDYDKKLFPRANRD